MDGGPYKRDLRELSQPLWHVRTQGEEAIYKPGGGLLPDTKFVDTSILDFLASRSVKNGMFTV